MSWGTVSNAFLISRKTAIAISPLWSAVIILCERVRMADAVDLAGTNPCCCGHMMSLSTRKRFN